MEYYRRWLPHWQPEEVPIFLTWRLYGSRPRNAGPRPATEGQRFALDDQALDRAPLGPTWLKDSRIAGAVQQILLTGESVWELYHLHAWVIMPNHVHMLVQPYRRLREITRAVKSASAREANLILDRAGQTFLQKESYDRWVRDDREFTRIVHYIEWNPVKAGWVEQPQDWKWSSAHLTYIA